MSGPEPAIDPARRLQHALDLALRFLWHRERTVHEVRAKLQDKRVEPATIDEVIAELEQLGTLDDARFARLFAEDRRTLDSWGHERIERRLTALGVDRDHVAAALTAGGGHDELEAALVVLRRRFPAPPETDRDRDRALGVLIRKGYDLELAYDAVRAHTREAAERFAA